MSSELLFNFEKTDTKKLDNSSSSTLNRSNKNEKKEGASLFDSLLSEAKSEEPNTPSKTTETEKKVPAKVETDTKQTETNKENKTQIQTQETNNVSESKDVEKKSPTNSVPQSEESESSLKKMIDKLVDIIVNSAKELKNSEKTKGSLQSEVVKDKINQLLENKLIDSSKLGELKSEVNKIINTTKKNALETETIKSEVSKVLKGSTLENISEKLSDVNKNLNNIKSSVDVISDSNKEIKKVIEKVDNQKTGKDLSTLLETEKKNIKSETLSIKENLEVLVDDIENSKLKNESTDSSEKELKKVKKDIKSNMSTISDAVEKIESSISKSEVEKTIKEIPQKVEYQVETIKEAVKDIEKDIPKVVIVKTTGDVSLNETTIDENFISKESNTKENKNSLLSNMFLQSQKTTKETTSLEQIKDAKDTILNTKTLEAVKDGAKKLNLELENTDVEHQGDENKKAPMQNNENKNNGLSSRILNQALLNEKLDDANKNINDLRYTQLEREQIKKPESDHTNKSKTDIIELNVPRDVIQNLQSKIIGAQQKMGGFMSEVARNMYLNYKPPVTAFRMNLNPANLGSIAIVMKANKMDNSLTVSMNLSNSNTLDSFIENKAALQNALQKQFNESSNVTLDFGMQNQDSENSFSQFSQDSNNKNTNDNGTEENINNIEEEQELVENNEYM